jgi:hypothetical protein
MPFDHSNQQQKVGCDYPFSSLHRKQLNPVKIRAFLGQFEQERVQNSRASATNTQNSQDPGSMGPRQAPGCFLDQNERVAATVNFFSRQ